MKNIIMLMMTVILTGCVSPRVDKTLKFTSWDKRTNYNITESVKGFNVAVTYSRYQFVPDFHSMFNKCKEKSYFIAQEEAYKKSKKIIPVDFKTLVVSMGRNSITGVTSCSATLLVSWDNAENLK